VGKWKGIDMDRVSNETKTVGDKFSVDVGEAGLNGHAPSQKPTVNLTDVGNSKRLVARYGDRLRYVPKHGWLWYDSKRWADVDEIFVMGRAKETLLAMKEEGLKLQRSNDAAEQETGRKLGGWATASEMGYHLERMVTYARDEVLASMEDFDRDHWLFNAQDCTIDLRTGLTHKHTPTDMLTKIAGTAYDEDIEGSRFTQFIDEIFEGDPDTAVYVQKLLGLSLTGDTSEKHVWFPTGGGDNGKSLLFEITGEAMGEYATVGQKEVIVTHDKSYRGKTFGTANLVGYRRAVFAETEVGDKLNWDVIKPMTGQDTMPVEEKFKKAFNVLMKLKVFIYTNDLPKTESVGMAEWSRIRVIPFNRCFNDLPGCKQADKKLREKLRKELPAILRWLVGGCILWQEYGLIEPKSVLEATTIYQENEDPLHEFLLEETVKDSEAKTRLSELYNAYLAWFEGARFDAMNDKEFGKAIASHGYISKKSHGVKVYLGIRLKKADDKPRDEDPDSDPD
jgi:putative DNA primase/helicase